MDKEERIDEIKETIKSKIDNITDERILSTIYAEMIGCMNCNFNFTCTKKRGCNVSILHYMKTGEVL